VSFWQLFEKQPRFIPGKGEISFLENLGRSRFLVASLLGMT